MVGTFSVDSLGEVVEDEPDTSFLTHEINFYQVSVNRTSYTVDHTGIHWTSTYCTCVRVSVQNSVGKVWVAT